MGVRKGAGRGGVETEMKSEQPTDTYECGRAAFRSLSHSSFHHMSPDSLQARARLGVLAGQVMLAGPDSRGGSRPDEAGVRPRTARSVLRPPPAIAVLGGSVADVTAWPSSSLTPGGSVPGRVTLAPGGVGRNLASTAAVLLKTTPHHSVSLISAVGDDALGRALTGSLAASGLDPGACVVRVVPGTATPAVVSVLDGRGEVAASVADFEGGGGEGGGALAAAFGMESAAAAALEAARVSRSTLVALDGNLAPAALAAVSSGLAAASFGRAPDLFEPVSVAKAGRAIAAGVRVGLATPNAAELGAMAAAVRARDERNGGEVEARRPSPPPSSLPLAVAASVSALAPDALAVLAGRWARGLVVTLGGAGAVFLTCEDGGKALPLGPHAPPPPPALGHLRACFVPAVSGVAVISAVGAGDALAGGVLAASVNSPVSVPAAVGLGAAAAAQVVACREAAPPLDAGRARVQGTGLAGRAVWWDV